MWHNTIDCDCLQGPAGSAGQTGASGQTGLTGRIKLWLSIQMYAKHGKASVLSTDMRRNMTQYERL